MNVANLTPLAMTSIIIREFIVEKGLMSAVNVENIFLGDPPF